MKIIRNFIIVLGFSTFLLYHIESASADFYSGETLAKMVKDKSDDARAILTGYVAGVQDSLNGTYFCVPPQIGLQQSVEIVRKYVTERPEEWHEVGKSLIARALRKKFSCDLKKDSGQNETSKPQ